MTPNATRWLGSAARTRGRKKQRGPRWRSVWCTRRRAAAAAGTVRGSGLLEVALAQPGAALGDGVEASGSASDARCRSPGRGRWSPSETSATITGVIAAPNRVPPPHSRPTTRAAASDEVLAVTNGLTERPPDLACFRHPGTSYVPTYSSCSASRS